MRRLTRKKLKQDEFVTIVDQMMDWAQDNWKPLVIALVAVCVVFLGWWGTSSFKGHREATASFVLNEAVQLYQADEASGTPKPEDLKAVQKKFEDVLKRYGGTDQGDVARLYLARIALETNDVAKARTLLKGIVRRHAGDAVGRVAMLNLIDLRINSGEAAEVAQDLEAMISGRDDRLPRDTAMYELGRALMKEQKTEKAKEYFQKLIKDFPNSPYGPMAREQIRKLG
jgi:predicted negative regulator of RcsB-dependent stress response